MHTFINFILFVHLMDSLQVIDSSTFPCPSYFSVEAIQMDSFSVADHLRSKQRSVGLMRGGHKNELVAFRFVAPHAEDCSEKDFHYRM